jgi:Cu(I)/Ag(I) efflux system membrane fusion protein/cobalt-zinc-cadmium efflux system membrane fusion protein
VNDHSEIRDYRRAFWLVLVIAVAAIAVAVSLWLRLGREKPKLRESSQRSTAEIASPASGSPSSTEMPGMNEPTQEAPLAPVQLSPQRMQSIGLQIGKVEYKPVKDELRLYGNVQANERRIEYVQTRFAGWIKKVYVNAAGDFVRKGQPLFTIYSPDLVTTEQEYLLAKRNQVSLQKSPVSGAPQEAASLVELAKQRLLQWQISPEQIETLDKTGKVINELTFYSPISGYVTERNALPNLYVQPETRLYTIADLSQVWVLAQVFQNDAGKIKPGDPAEVTVDAYPGKTFRGRVDYLLPQVDMTTRTVPVRLVFSNPGLRLRPGMYVNVKIGIPLGRELVVPASAAFHSGVKNLLFLYRGEGRIEPREVQFGPRVNDQMVVLSGAKAGDQIVTSANFLIDSEAQLQAAAGAFMPPPPGAGQAAAMNAKPVQQARLEFSTDPSPARKGSNTVRVNLTGADGKPIDGADVTVTFFMPAMPAMGMSAMKTTIHAAEKANGTYEGHGDLGSGGSWQVTIVAQKDGQIVALKQLTITAEGGM